MLNRKPNIRIIQTQITNEIRVSTAGIFYGDYGGRYQYETFVLSGDSKQKSFQVIHGSSGYISFPLLKKSIKIHRHISDNLKRRFKVEQ